MHFKNTIKLDLELNALKTRIRNSSFKNEPIFAIIDSINE